MKKLLLTLACIAICSPLLAQDYHYYNHNLNTTGRSLPDWFTEFKGRLYFTAYQNNTGYELWSLDTGSAPRLECHINPGASSGIPGMIEAPNGIRLAPFEEFAIATDAEGKPLAMYFYGSNVQQTNLTLKTELFRYSGSGAPVKLTAHNTDSNPYDGTSIVAIGSKVYYTVTTALQNELKEYDHFTGKDTLIIDQSYGSVSSLTVFNSKLLFTNKDAVYEFDAVLRNIRQVTSFISYLPAYIMPLNGKAYIHHTGSVYEYDGSTVKKVISDQRNLTEPFYYSSSTKGMMHYKGRIYYSGKSGTTTTLFAYSPGSGTSVAIGGVVNPQSFAIANNTLYFGGYDTAHGYEVWAYNGSGKPTRLTDIMPGKGDGFQYDITSFKNKIYLVGRVDSSGVWDEELLELMPATTGTIINNVFSAIKEVTVYPNPATTAATLQMNLQHSATLQVKMVDMTGRTVYTIAATTYTAGETKLNLPMASLATGTYAYIISDESGKLMHSGRIQKQ